MERDRSLFRAFGLDPERIYVGAAHDRYARRLRDAIDSRLIVSVVGAYGSGKTTLVQHTLAEMPHVEAVYVTNPDRERLRIGHIVATLVTVLSGEQENPRRSATGRDIQVSRLVGEAVVRRKREVCLVIENAHRLPVELLLALKDLRESVRFKGIGFLFSIVLVGQEMLAEKLRRFGEVDQRTRRVEFTAEAWLGLDERTAYLRHVYGDLLTDGARAILAERYTTPLALDHTIQERMLLMREAGVEHLDETMLPSSPAEEARRAVVRIRDGGYSVRQIEAASGVPKSTVEDVKKGRNDDPTTIARIQSAIDKLAREAA